MAIYRQFNSRSFTDEDIQKVAALKASNALLKDIVKQTKLSHSTVRKIIYEYNLAGKEKVYKTIPFSGWDFSNDNLKGV